MNRIRVLATVLAVAVLAACSSPNKPPAPGGDGLFPHQLQTHTGVLAGYLIAPPSGATVHTITPGKHGTGIIAADADETGTAVKDEATEWFTTAAGEDVKIDLTRFNSINDAGRIAVVEVATDKQTATDVLPATHLEFALTFVDTSAPDYQVDAFATDGDVVIEVTVFLKMASTDNPTATAANALLTAQYNKLVG